METSICKNCGTEMSEIKELCHNCQNEKSDKRRKIGQVALGTMSVILIGVLKYFSKSDNDQI